MVKKEFSFIDLFAGIGGFRLALEQVGGRCLGFSEINSDAISTYCENFNEEGSRNFGDITKIESLPQHDFMTAGVPCQSWSIAGKNLGFDDDRGQLWNDALYLLNKVRPKAFIFENVKGLSDPRNQDALNYILGRIKDAGYYAKPYLLNAFDYGVPQHRIRIYIIGFRDKKFADKFSLPVPSEFKVRLRDVLDDGTVPQGQLFDSATSRWSLSMNMKGMNDYFLFNDIRDGQTTIHSWDILDTTERQKEICLMILRNRRKRIYGKLDGNPLSLENLKSLDESVTQDEVDELVEKGILKPEEYLFQKQSCKKALDEDERAVLNSSKGDILNVDDLKTDRNLKIKKVNVLKTLDSLMEKGAVKCVEIRYDFKNSKISTGLFGVNRIFLPSSNIYPTLVASDTNDFITSTEIDADNIEDFRKDFLDKVYKTHNFRRITKAEACRIQGFPDNYILPSTRPRWMKLIGNSVAVPVINKLARAVVATGVFD